MDDLEFMAAFVVLLLAALACHITKFIWQKEDAAAQAAWDQEEAERSYRHDEPSQTGPVRSRHLGLVTLLTWVTTVAFVVVN